MGSDNYHGANSDCYHCSGCGTYRACDDCSAGVCQNNMNSHRRLRRLEDLFEEEVNKCPKMIMNELASIIDDLKKYYDIKIYYDSKDTYIDEIEHILEKLELRKSYIINKKDSIKENDYIRKIKDKINNLKDDHQLKMKRMENDFKLKASEFKNVSKEMEMLNTKIKIKQKEVNNLENEKYKLENRKSKREIFEEQQERIFKEKFEKEKKEINLKYDDFDNINYPIKEYSQEEKELKNSLLKNIVKIKNYPIPESFIISTGLINYLY
jgi:hypothetical protein